MRMTIVVDVDGTSNTCYNGSIRSARDESRVPGKKRRKENVAWSIHVLRDYHHIQSREDVSNHHGHRRKKRKEKQHP